MILVIHGNMVNGTNHCGSACFVGIIGPMDETKIKANIPPVKYSKKIYFETINGGKLTRSVRKLKTNKSSQKDTVV
jgi:hypothetical protein